MKKEIVNLNQYISMMGDITKLDLSKTHITYNGYQRAIISNITENGWNAERSAKLFMVTFKNGSTMDFAGLWIETTVELVLDPKYVDPKFESLSV